MKTFKALLLIVLSITVFSCSSSLNLVTDYDVTVDFNQYKTYMFLPWNKENSEYITDPAKKKLYQLLEDELNSRGLTKVQTEGDLAINLLVLLEEKRAATAYTRYYSTGPVGYYSSFGYGYQSTTYYKKEDILEGTIIVDAFDHKERNLIWQGIAIQEIVEQDAKRQRQVSGSIKKMFESFPKN